MFPSPEPLHKDQVEQLIDDLSQLSSYSIGRRSDNAIAISDPKISGLHARLIHCTDTIFVLEDLDSKNGTFVNDTRITRKIVGKNDTLRLADTEYRVDQLLNLLTAKSPVKTIQPESLSLGPVPAVDKKLLDFTREFAGLQSVYEQYPKLRRDCRNREKMIRTGSAVLSSVVGVSAALATGGGALLFIQLLSSAGLGVLIPSLCSTLLSTDEKLELIDKEYREQYRCPNPTCRDPFGTREWDLLAQQKTCRRCQAIWVR